MRIRHGLDGVNHLVRHLVPAEQRLLELGGRGDVADQRIPLLSGELCLECTFSNPAHTRCARTRSRSTAASSSVTTCDPLMTVNPVSGAPSARWGRASEGGQVARIEETVSGVACARAARPIYLCLPRSRLLQAARQHSLHRLNQALHEAVPLRRIGASPSCTFLLKSFMIVASYLLKYP